MLALTDEPRILSARLRARLESAFERVAVHGLLELGIREVGTALPADFAYWRDFAGRYVTRLCTSAQSIGATGPAAVSTIETPPAEMLGGTGERCAADAGRGISECRCARRTVEEN